ncbi:MAG: hypothetical protein JWR79_1097 [Tardiphaga sp.]|nr:hypothetical protein [Tardiphaga sp.]
MRTRPVWLCVAALLAGPAGAQTLTPDMLRPERDRISPSATPAATTFSSDMRLRRTDDNPADAPAPSRIGRIPAYGVPVASGAAVTGYNSLNRRRPARRPYPGTAKAPVSPGPGSPIPIVPEPPLTIPPSSLANKPPLAPAMAGTVPGQPPRKRLRPDLDPFGAVGDYAGSFLVKSAVEVSGGYDSNPGRFTTPRGSAFYMVSPELLVVSDWTRHAVIADLRGSFTGYGQQFPSTDGSISGVPTNVDRPDFIGHIDGRLDVTHETRLTSQARLRVSTDNPGSPNIQAGLSKYPLYSAIGTTIGAEQDFNRLSIGVGGTFDRIAYQDSQLTNGESTTNIDRNYQQYGGVARASYDILPGLRPFVEFSADTRIRDTDSDRSGYNRNSTGGTARVGSTFEFTRLITGEASIGYGKRMYQDTRLKDLTGLLTSASLAWAVTPLTTVRAISTSSLDESTLLNASGVLSRTYTAEVSHDFRRWLTGVGRFTYGTFDYQGAGRTDELYSASADVIFKLNRTLQLKAQVRRDEIKSTVGYTTVSNVVLVGVRVQN